MANYYDDELEAYNDWEEQRLDTQSNTISAQQAQQAQAIIQQQALERAAAAASGPSQSTFTTTGLGLPSTTGIAGLTPQQIQIIQGWRATGQYTEAEITQIVSNMRREGQDRELLRTMKSDPFTQQLGPGGIFANIGTIATEINDLTGLGLTDDPGKISPEDPLEELPQTPYGQVPIGDYGEGTYKADEEYTELEQLVLETNSPALWDAVKLYNIGALSVQGVLNRMNMLYSENKQWDKPQPRPYNKKNYRNKYKKYANYNNNYRGNRNKGGYY